jgi:hypothetical protein
MFLGHMIVMTPRSLYRTSVKSFSIAAIVLLAACSGDSNLVRDTFGAVGAGPKTAETPDFVRQSRPASLDYVPIGTAAEERPTPAMTPEQVKAVEAQMEAVRSQNEAAARVAAQAGATPPPAPVKAPGQSGPPKTPKKTSP